MVDISGLNEAELARIKNIFTAPETQSLDAHLPFKAAGKRKSNDAPDGAFPPANDGKGSGTQDRTGNLELHYDPFSLTQANLGTTQKDSNASSLTAKPTQESDGKHQHSDDVQIPSSAGRGHTPEPTFPCTPSDLDSVRGTPQKRDYFDEAKRFGSPPKEELFRSPAIGELITGLPSNSAFTNLTQIFETSSPLRIQQPTSALATPAPATKRPLGPMRALSSPTKGTFADMDQKQEPAKSKRSSRKKTKPATSYTTIDDSQKARAIKYRFARSTSPEDDVDYNERPPKPSILQDSWDPDDDSLGRQIRAGIANRQKNDEVLQMFTTLKAPLKQNEDRGKRKGTSSDINVSAIDDEGTVGDIEVVRSDDEEFDGAEVFDQVIDTDRLAQKSSSNSRPGSRPRTRSIESDSDLPPTQVISNPSATSRLSGKDTPLEWDEGDEPGAQKGPRRSQPSLAPLTSDHVRETSTISDSQPSVTSMSKEDGKRSGIQQALKGRMLPPRSSSMIMPNNAPQIPNERNQESEQQDAPIISSSPPSINGVLVKESSPQPAETPCRPSTRPNKLNAPSTVIKSPNKDAAAPTPLQSPLAKKSERAGSGKRKSREDSSQTGPSQTRSPKRVKGDRTSADQVVPCSLEEDSAKKVHNAEEDAREEMDTEPEGEADEKAEEEVPEQKPTLRRKSTGAAKNAGRQPLAKRQSTSGIQKVTRKPSSSFLQPPGIDVPRLKIPRKTRSGTSLRQSGFFDRSTRESSVVTDIHSAISHSTAPFPTGVSLPPVPNRVFALFKDGRLFYHPATVLPSPMTATASHYNIQFDDGTKVQTEKAHVRALDLKPGDHVRVDMPNMKQKVWEVIETKVGSEEDVGGAEKAHFTDIEGNNVVVLKSRSKSEEITATVPITKLYIAKSQWSQFSKRPHIPVGTIPPSVAESPMTPSRRRTSSSAMQVSMVTPIPSFVGSRQGIFTGMLFAITIGERDSEKAEIVKLIGKNGGEILEPGFEKLFTLPSSSDESAELLPLPHTAGIGFTAVLSDKHCRRAKFLQALALGIPCLHIRWVKDCIKQNTLIPWSSYLLPAGESSYLSGAIRSRTLPYLPAESSTFLESVAQRPRLLDGKSVLFVTGKGAAAEARRRPYLFLLYALGPERVVCVSAAEGGAGEAGAVDYVYCDAAGRRKRGLKAVGGGGEVVGDEWVVQSLILGKLIEGGEVKE